MAPPSTYRFGSMTLSQKHPVITMWPESLYVQDHHYCFNEVHLQYVATQGAFVNPSASVTGGFDGTDFEGNTAHYIGEGLFQGTPAVGYSQPLSLFHSARTTTGQLAFALPQGTWKLSPSATFVNDDGTQSNFSKGKANEENLFHAMGDGWIFNLDVRPLGEGSRTLRVDLGDGRFHDVVILVGSSGS